MFFSLMGIYDGKLGESEVCILLNDVTEKTNFVKNVDIEDDIGSLNELNVLSVDWLNVSAAVRDEIEYVYVE